MGTRRDARRDRRAGSHERCPAWGLNAKDRAKVVRSVVLDVDRTPTLPWASVVQVAHRAKMNDGRAPRR